MQNQLQLFCVWLGEPRDGNPARPLPAVFNTFCASFRTFFPNKKPCVRVDVLVWGISYMAKPGFSWCGWAAIIQMSPPESFRRVLHCTAIHAWGLNEIFAAFDILTFNLVPSEDLRGAKFRVKELAVSGHCQSIKCGAGDPTLLNSTTSSRFQDTNLGSLLGQIDTK